MHVNSSKPVPPNRSNSAVEPGCGVSQLLGIIWPSSSCSSAQIPGLGTDLDAPLRNPTGAEVPSERAYCLEAPNGLLGPVPGEGAMVPEFTGNQLPPL